MLLGALYRLFKGVDQNQAVLMVILGGVLPSAIYFFNVLNDAGIIISTEAYTAIGSRSTSPGRDGKRRPRIALRTMGFVPTGV